MQKQPVKNVIKRTFCHDLLCKAEKTNPFSPILHSWSIFFPGYITAVPLKMNPLSTQIALKKHFVTIHDACLKQWACFQKYCDKA